MAQNYKKSGEYARVISFTDKDAHGVRTENMYIDYNREDISLESFPGYRKLAKLNGKINGIYTVENGSEVYLIHSGKNLYRCEFTNAYRDELNYQSIAVMNDRRSHGYLMNGELCIFDGEDVTLIDKTLTPKKLSQNPHLAYVPTTYINGKEAEELNILSESFNEKYEGITVSEMAYESEGLIYQIKNEKTKTCTVAGISGSVSGRVEIPSKKLINGSYYTVVEIGKNAFMGNKNITGLITSPTVQTVAENAFSGCSSLSLAAMVDGIESIDNSAFYGCTKLTQVYIGVSCKKIHFNAFYACNSLTYVYFSGDSSQIIECDGFSDMLRFEVEYWKPYKNLAIGIEVIIYYYNEFWICLD